MLVLAAVGVGALLAWVVSRGRDRSPGSTAGYATGPTAAPDPPPGPSADPLGNVPAVTTEWAPARQGIAGFGPVADADRNGGAAHAGPAARPASPPPLPREGLLSGATLLGIAAIVGLVAVGLGTYAFASRDTRTKTVTVTVATPAAPTVRQALALIASQTTERIPLAHSVGRIVLTVTPDGRALLVVHGLGRAPAGRSYQAWVIPPGKTVPVSAALFRGAELVVPLGPVVERGAVVAVTLERAGGAPGPSHAPTLVAKRA